MTRESRDNFVGQEPSISKGISWVVFMVSLVCYWVTAGRDVAFWDCPEYVTVASLLEVGHPPGNAFWALTMRVATMFFSPPYHAFVINLCSGVFMALGAMLLCRIIFFFLSLLIPGRDGGGVSERFPRNPEERNFFFALSSFGGAMCFALCGSAWFSAVESEVYAMSAFFTSLVIWLMTLWFRSRDEGRKKKLICLVVYLTGLSLGVHQLGLLCIPVCVLIWSYGKYPDNSVYRWLSLLISFVVVGCVLAGLLTGVVEVAGLYELMFTNQWGLKPGSGVWIYVAVMLLLFTWSLGFNSKFFPGLPKPGKLLIVGIGSFLFIWQTGLFVFSGNFWAGGILTFILMAALVAVKRFERGLQSIVAGLFILLVGYSSIVMWGLRGSSATPLNTGNPSNPFRLESYISRDQYGKVPLIYGPTPYSEPILIEEYDSMDDTPRYNRYLLKKGKTHYSEYSLLGEIGGEEDKVKPEARIYDRSGFMTHEDSIYNEKIRNHGEGYFISGHDFSRVTTPELDMWFPRITGNSPAMVRAYADWAGMTPETMKEVEVSVAIDSLGNFIKKKTAKRPTYLQNLRFFLTYQLGYMYFRYLGWNFIGRQNDIASGGEIEHGNVITGFEPIDGLMVGGGHLMPSGESKDNRGRNTYFALPFIIGLLGIIYLFTQGKAGLNVAGIIFLLFLMTGPAIVVYLNQTPLEPRERDYAFLGSYMAFAMYIGVGLFAFMSWLTGFSQRTWLGIVVGLLASIGLPLMLGTVNFDDNDRRGRDEPYEFAREILSEERPSIFISQGDNFTFPLWYVQEVRDEGKIHTIVDISCLSSPEYVVNLMKQGEKGLKLIASLEDIKYGAYTSVEIPSVPALVSSRAVPTEKGKKSAVISTPSLEELLQTLYANKEGKPRFITDRFTLNGNTYFLRDFSGGKKMMSFRQLMILDILASNFAKSEGKRIYFLTGTRHDYPHSMSESFRRGFHGTYLDWDSNDSIQEQEIIESLSRGGQYRLEGYIDPTTAQQARWKRAEMILAGKLLLERGRANNAAAIIRETWRRIPYSKVDAGVVGVSDTNFYEGEEYVRLLQDIADSLSGSNLQQSLEFRHIADSLDQIMEIEEDGWLRYYESLSAWQRNAVSGKTLRKVSRAQKRQSVK